VSAVLDAVREAAQARDAADSDFRRLLREAHGEGHSLAEIGRAAGLTKQGVRWLIRREESTT